MTTEKPGAPATKSAYLCWRWGFVDGFMVTIDWCQGKSAEIIGKLLQLFTTNLTRLDWVSKNSMIGNQKYWKLETTFFYQENHGFGLRCSLQTIQWIAEVMSKPEYGSNTRDSWRAQRQIKTAVATSTHTHDIYIYIWHIYIYIHIYIINYVPVVIYLFIFSNQRGNMNILIS